MPRLHPAARVEIRSTAAWYEDQRDGLGLLLLDDVDHALARIDTFPQAGARWRYPGQARDVRAVTLRRFPYRVYYLLSPDALVVAFAHSAREPDWLARLDEGPAG